MPDIIIDTTRLLSRIVLSQELTALEKRYLERLIVQDMSAKPPEDYLPPDFKNELFSRFDKRR
jgi:hypothetical protein